MKLLRATVWPHCLARNRLPGHELWGSSRNRAWMTSSNAGQDGWILAKFFFFFACLWTETESRSISSPKKERGQYRVIYDRTSVVNKGSVMWLAGNFFMRDISGSSRAGKMAPSCQLAAQDLVRLAHSVSHYSMLYKYGKRETRLSFCIAESACNSVYYSHWPQHLKLQQYVSARSLRSNSDIRLNTTHKPASPKVFNSLPTSFRLCDNIHEFNRRAKIYF